MTPPIQAGGGETQVTGITRRHSVLQVVALWTLQLPACLDSGMLGIVVTQVGDATQW